MQTFIYHFSCRAANVFSCAYLVNLVRPAHRKIPVKHQQALWYSGKNFRITYLFIYLLCDMAK